MTTTFNSSDFNFNGQNYLTKRAKLGYKPYSKFNAPKRIKIEGESFDLRTSWVHITFGIQFEYVHPTKNLTVTFW